MGPDEQDRETDQSPAKILASFGAGVAIAGGYPARWQGRARGDGRGVVAASGWVTYKKGRIPVDAPPIGRVVPGQMKSKVGV